ncbi:MAG: nicotinate (nicotinamide) nucleotide adenylyltransferase [Aquificae bacterium]|nr:nicotinate (nicotinamide) nucleotide adenylyltransferase [Aquificota bacterium]
MYLVFGGSFDPVHFGHVLLARDALERLKAEKVLFIPAYKAPLKEGHAAPPEDRLRMLRLAVEGEDRFAVEDYEVKKGGTSYTVDTLKYLRNKYGKELYLLLGADAFLNFHRWREPEEVARLARLVVADREGKLAEAERYLTERFPHLKERVLFLKTRRFDVSSTEIRKRIKEGRSVYGMLPEAVERYVLRKGLYRA